MSTIAKAFNVIHENNRNIIICNDKNTDFKVYRSRCAIPIKYTEDLKGKYLTIKIKEYNNPFCIKIKNYVNNVEILKEVISKEFALPLLDTSRDSFDILGVGTITVMPCSAGNLLDIVKTYTNNNNFRFIGTTKNGFFDDVKSDRSDLYYIKDDFSESSTLSSTLYKNMVVIYGDFGVHQNIKYSIESILKNKMNNNLKNVYCTNKKGEFIFRAFPLSETKITIENGKSRKLNIPDKVSFLNFDQLKSYNILSDWEM